MQISEQMRSPELRSQAPQHYTSLSRTAAPITNFPCFLLKSMRAAKVSFYNQTRFEKNNEKNHINNREATKLRYDRADNYENYRTLKTTKFLLFANPDGIARSCLKNSFGKTTTSTVKLFLSNQKGFSRI